MLFGSRGPGLEPSPPIVSLLALQATLQMAGLILPPLPLPLLVLPHLLEEGGGPGRAGGPSPVRPPAIL